MSIADHDDVIRLLQGQQGVVVRDADSREAMERYLDRNPGFSFVAEDDGQLIGCVMSGHDGRRGYLQHLMVRSSCRRRGVGRQLVDACLGKMRKQHVFKVHIDVLVGNHEGAAFWEDQGWQRRNDITRYSFISKGGANA